MKVWGRSRSGFDRGINGRRARIEQDKSYSRNFSWEVS